jgi:hypothetical protein
LGSISRARNPTKVPLANGGASASRQSSTRCQRRSHYRRLDHLVVGHPGIGLHDRRQRQLRGRHQRVPLRAVRICLRQLGLELLVKQLVTVLAQEHE